MVYDFHTHSTISDGGLLPMELIRRALVRGYKAIGISDHVAFGTTSSILPMIAEDCARASIEWDIVAFAGVEVTHVPANLIDDAARRARESGAQYVVVHGETIVEPVEEGTNVAALSSPHVDILAHPGLLTADEARIAARNGVYIEISARGGHAFANGRVVRIAQDNGARLILDSDAHAPDDLLTDEFARKVALGAGLDEDALGAVLQVNPMALIEKIQGRS